MELLVDILLGLGCFFILLASIGCVKFPDTLTRMAAVSKSSSLGTIFLCAAGMLHFAEADVIFQLGFTAAFLFLGIPIGSHLLGRARIHSNKGQPLKAIRNDYESDQVLKDCGSQNLQSAKVPARRNKGPQIDFGPPSAGF